MKSLMIVVIAVFSLSAFAELNKTSVASLLKNKEVIKVVKKMDKAGLNLAVIEDVNASAGVVPRCPCSSYKLTFSGYDKESKIVNVNINELGGRTTISE